MRIESTAHVAVREEIETGLCAGLFKIRATKEYLQSNRKCQKKDSNNIRVKERIASHIVSVLSIMGS